MPVSASATVSQIEPVQTPWAPSASAAAICRPVPMPPAASTGTSAPTASTTSGTSTIVEISPVCPPASVPCATMMSTPMFDLLLRVHLAADEGGDEHAVVVRAVDDVLRRRAERVDEQLARVLQRDVDRAGRLVVDAEPGRDRAALVDLCRDRRHVVLGEHLLDELPVPLRDHRRELLGRRLLAARADVVGRHDEVDAVRLAVDVVVDPVQLDLELLGGEREGAEDAEAAGAADRGDDVAAVREREDRELDAELVTDGCAHRCSRIDENLGTVADLCVVKVTVGPCR